MKKKWLSVLIMAVIVVAVMAAVFVLRGDIAKTRVEEIGCEHCNRTGICRVEDCPEGCAEEVCAVCGGSTMVAIAYDETSSAYYATWISLLPPVIAIALALVLKEVYFSLFVGIVAGGLLLANFNVKNAFVTVVEQGFIGSLADSSHVGILVFLVVLGTVVVLMNKAGGSAAYGNWAVKNIKTRKGAMLSTFGLGCLIFVDDYFNCLTVGSVMRPLTDKHKISRAKLAYLIDATAAPICMIAPISSWAAAVASYYEGDSITGFIQAIPFNFYSLLTIVTVIGITLLNLDFGSMKRHEKNAVENGDLFSGGMVKPEEKTAANPKGKVMDLVIPVVILIICCIFGMLYTGGVFEGVNIVTAFAECDASLGLALGSVLGLILDILYFVCRRVISFKACMEAMPEGFQSMVPAILILTFAWTICSMTGALGGKYFVSELINGAASSLQALLPAIIFLIACGLSFATGTSWGTFGILIPIVVSAFSGTALGSVALSACLAGAVCGDHCSPISDTTIMASAGAQCDHINHVSTQLPYALVVAAVSFVSYLIAGVVPNAWVALPAAVVLMVATLLGIKLIQKRGKNL